MADSLPHPQPSWLQPLITVTTQVGVPTVMAGVLLWFVLTQLHGMLDTIQHAEEERTRLLVSMQESLIGAIDRQTQAFQAAIKEMVYANRELATRYPPPPPAP